MELNTTRHQMINTILKHFTKIFNTCNSYDRIVFAGDFNTEEKEVCMKSFLCQHDFKNLVNEITCFKYSSKAITVDLFSTNNITYFQNTKAIFTGLSNFCKQFAKILKINFPKNNLLK